MNLRNNQLLILGNGFDRECQLNSQFSDYFQTRMAKPWLNANHNNWSENPNDPENLWDHIFNSEKKNSPKDWKDAESIILKWVSCKKTEDYEEIASPIRKRYDIIQKAEMRMKRESLPSTLPKRVENSYSEDSYRELLFDELKLMEEAFEDYLVREASAQFYIQNSYVLFCALRDANTNEDLRETANYILSFNYTTPQASKVNLLNDLHIECWRNVHGQLGKGNIIFGIDMNQLSEDQKTNPKIRQFTKTYRVLKQSRVKSMTADSIGLFEPFQNGETFDSIKFYGHSLGRADYSYFKAIFDRIDLYGSDTRLLFYYPSDHPNIENELYPQITDLLTSYGESMPDRSRGNNLLHKLLLEGRLSLSELEIPDLEPRPTLP
ncbi:AbiH family protein [Bifidobacterium moukalabense]|uniref:AbiH family protein n=1 Tax=Bifidobacterium moukalabense TaxID=1333651 RepID=UPI0010F79673|nr:AbiH family protein [Bifidobacterium moukalabense]